MIASTGSTTTVLIVLLVVIGLVMIGTAVWLVVATRRDAPALAPLEVMGGRRFARATSEARAATIAGARPAGALPPSPMLPLDGDADIGADADRPEPVSEPDVGDVDPTAAAAAAEVEEAEAIEVAEPEVEPQPEVDATIEVSGPDRTQVVDDEVGAVVEDEMAELDVDERVPAPESS